MLHHLLHLASAYNLIDLLYALVGEIPNLCRLVFIALQGVVKTALVVNRRVWSSRQDFLEESYPAYLVLDGLGLLNAFLLNALDEVVRNLFWPEALVGGHLEQNLICFLTDAGIVVSKFVKELCKHKLLSDARLHLDHALSLG